MLIKTFNFNAGVKEGLDSNQYWDLGFEKYLTKWFSEHSVNTCIEILGPVVEQLGVELSLESRCLLDSNTQPLTCGEHSICNPTQLHNYRVVW